LPALARTLRTNKATIWHWYKGENLPQLESLLKLCYQLDTSLLDFVTGKVIGKCSVTVTVSPPEEKNIQRPPRPHRPLDKEEATQFLQYALKEMPPSSLQDVAARLDRDANTLRYWFADLCKAIAERYAEYKKTSLAKSWKEIEIVLLMILNEEKPPSMAQVATRLGYDVKTLTKHYPGLCREISARHAGNYKIRWEEIKGTLQTALAEYPPPSLLRLAERLGLSKSSLYEHFPNLCHQIARQYVSHRANYPL
jgi:transcriptional regulator with XRE-family HTH domain